MPKKTAIDKAIDQNLDKIRELTAVNDALRQIQADSRRKRKPTLVKKEHANG